MAARPPQPLTQHRPPRPIRRGPAPPSPSPSPSSNKIASRISGITVKRLVWTGAFAAVTIVSAIYGAGLKTQSEFKQEKRKIVEATPEDRIRYLEARRAALVAQKSPFERKLADLRARMSAQERKDGGVGGEGAAAGTGTGGKK
ncbi:hypothetical protein F4813DRAFT_385205 [Daldinia decipiens]|uniref:uncharacterized protein n=1 Tax=Daldinia decipiens TaxID=326647 RepID=UPI0020C2B9E7|nr:uncharacterized protein F4813DRAFT_385205 [Daldinia decipiens]KAI1662488.1 hypothetical protein F4813DRAFT_385205 [Daldinia decipiens]